MTKRATGAAIKGGNVHVRVNAAERVDVESNARALGFGSGKGPGHSTAMREALLDPERFADRVVQAVADGAELSATAASE